MTAGRRMSRTPQALPRPGRPAARDLLARLTEARKVVDVRNQLPPCRIVYRREDAMVTVVRVWRSDRLMSPTTCAGG